MMEQKNSPNLSPFGRYGGFDFPSPWLTFPVFSQYLKVEIMQFMLLLKDSKNQTKYVSNVTKFCQIYGFRV